LKTLHKLVAAGVVAAAATTESGMSEAAKVTSLDLGDAVARTDRLVVQPDARLFLIGLGPFRIDRVGEGRTGAGNIGSHGGRDTDGLLQFPTLTAGVVPVVNIDGVKPGDLVLDGSTLARIFLGKIKSWNDAAIRKLNPNVKLPSQAIRVVYRSDGSGTTFVFTDYLGKVSADWRSKVGSTTAVEWPVGIGASGNEGAARGVAGMKGAIGYVEYAYVKQNKLTYARLMNKGGKAVAPTIESFSAAATRANWEGTPGFGVILTNEAGAASWPIAGATFILIHKQPGDPAAAGAALKFFNWAYAKGGRMAQDLDYVPMPPSVVSAVQRLWAAEIKDASGKPLFVLPK